MEPSKRVAVSGCRPGGTFKVLSKDEALEMIRSVEPRIDNYKNRVIRNERERDRER